MPINKGASFSTKDILSKGQDVPSKENKRKPRRNFSQKEVDEIYDNFPSRR